MITESIIREKIALYLNGEMDLDQFEDWLVEQSWNMHKQADPSTQELVGAIELRFAEHSTGHLDISDLNEEFRMLLAHGHKSRVLQIPLVWFGSNPATSISTTSQEHIPIQRIVMGGGMVTSGSTSSGTSRTITREQAFKVA